ncbi:MAG: alpha/beta hydrolase family protein [Micropepsaceae bacterium]
MRVLRFLFYTVLVLIGLAVAGVAALWALNPFAPEVTVADPAPEGRRITESGLVANYYPPKGEGKHPGVLLLGGSEGGLGTGGARMAKALQEKGYAVLHASYFGAPGQNKILALVPLETFDRALDWLKAQNEVDAERLAIVGGSKGAEAALIVAARHPELRAVVAGMPSNVAWQGIDMNIVNMMFNPPGGSWSLGGKPIPFVPYVQPKEFTGDIGAIYAASLLDLPKHEDAIIPIEKTRAPVLLICGKQDTLWPACPMADQVKARADAKGGPTVTVLAYDDAGHAVMGLPVEKSNKNYDRLDSLGGTDDGNNAARTDGWAKVIAHLEAALAAPN